MQIEINEFICKVTPIEKPPHQNLLANASVSFKAVGNQYFTITGFSVWKSKYGGLSVQVPQKASFKFLLVEGSLWKTISNEIIEEYERSIIPIVQVK
jgi:hypothetical protein